MDSSELGKEIYDLIINQGAGDAGFAGIENFNSHGLPRAVSVFVPLSKHILSEITDKPTYDYYAHYRAANSLIDIITLQTALFISKKGYSAHPVAASQSTGEHHLFASSFSHKIAATRSGKGFIGKNALFIHETFGSAVRLGTVLTDAPFECGEPAEKGECGSCMICADKCPASAVAGNEWSVKSQRSDLFDPRACSDYMKSRFSGITKGNACGICIRFCPRSKV